MPRIVKEHEYLAKRNEILDVAQRLIYTKGYEQVSIQDILVELKMSKGAFYHYFNSKQALMEALIERILEEVEGILLPIVRDPGLPAIEKLRLFFNVTARWKTDRKDYMLALLRIWYDDDNAVFRLKVYTKGLKWISPMLSEITCQGIREGTLDAPYPGQLGEILFSLFQGMGDSFAHLFLDQEPGLKEYQQLESAFAAYSAALERILGAPAGSLKLVEPETLKEWFVLPEGEKP